MVVCGDFNLFAHFVQEACKSSLSKGVSNPVVAAAASLPSDSIFSSAQRIEHILYVTLGTLCWPPSLTAQQVSWRRKTGTI